MYKLVYRNISNNTTIKEYLFYLKSEKRRMFLEQDDVELLSYECLCPPVWSKEFWRTFWYCLTNRTTYR